MKMYSSASEKLASRNSKESLMMLSLQPLNIDKVIGITWRPNTNKWWRDIAAPTSLLMLLYCSLSGWIQQQSRRDANDSKSPAKTDACLSVQQHMLLGNILWVHPYGFDLLLLRLIRPLWLHHWHGYPWSLKSWKNNPWMLHNGDNCLWRTTERDSERCSPDGLKSTQPQPAMVEKYHVFDKCSNTLFNCPPIIFSDSREVRRPRLCDYHWTFSRVNPLK